MTWWSRLFRRSRLEDDLDQEIRAHLNLAAEDRIARGESPGGAQTNAGREFGNQLLIKEVTRQSWGFSALERLMQDVRYALRQLRRNPGFTAVAILSLALGIGANTAIFSVLNAVLLRSLPIRAPEELYHVRRQAAIPVPQRYSYPIFEMLRDAASPAPVAAMSQSARMNIAIESGAQPERANVQLVSGEFFRLLEVSPSIGRVLSATDNKIPDGHPVAVLSYGYWRARFAGSPDVLGRTMTLNGSRFTIIGVANAGFKGVFLEAPTDIWIPMMMQSAVRYHQNFSSANNTSDKPWVPQDAVLWVDILLRANRAVAPSVIASLNTALQHWLASTAGSIGDPHQRQLVLGQRLVLETFARGQSRMRDRFTPLLLALMGMVAIVLVIACANTANLLLARSTARQREIAVRVSIGAGRGRLIQQLLTESFLMVAIAAAAGLLLARVSAGALVGMVIGSLTGQTPSVVSLDLRVLAFTVAVSALAGLLFGLAPALRATRVDLAASLKAAARNVQGRAHWAPAKLLVALQVALSLLLVMGAGLFGRSLYNLSHANWGFDQQRILTVWIDPLNSGITAPELPSFQGKLLERVRAVPGVTSAALAECGIASGCQSASDGIKISGYEPVANEQVKFQENRVSTDYLTTLSMRFLKGRNFDPRDRADSPKVAIVNQALVNRYFAGREPLGQLFGYEKPDTEIVGVIADAHVNSARERVTPMAFYPLEQGIVFPFSLEVRTSFDPEQATTAIRAAISEVAPNLIVERITPLSLQMEATTSPDRIVALLASSFGFLAIVLASIGLYGMMSYTVVRRTSEIGVRIALGARPGAILRSILRESMLVSFAGLAVGLPLSMFASKLIAQGLFGVEARDPSTLAGAAIVLTLVTCMAAFIPAWRASRVSPMVALRQE